MALGKALMGIEPCPMVKNSSLFTIGSNPFGALERCFSSIEQEET
jgi:hypothetical protein